MQIYKTRKGSEPEITEIADSICEGSWIWLLDPSEAELATVADQCRIPPEFLQAALDEEERPRIHIVTICSRRADVLDDFVVGKIRQFTTVKKTRFMFQIFYRNATYYLIHLRRIERKMTLIEVELRRSMKNEELFEMMELEKSLIYFSTSLKSNEAVLERMLRTKILKMYEEDAELLEDVIIENKQAMEMSQIYLHILNGMTQAFASIISNNLNIVTGALLLWNNLWDLGALLGRDGADALEEEDVLISFFCEEGGEEKSYGFWLVLRPPCAGSTAFMRMNPVPGWEGWWRSSRNSFIFGR